MNDIITGHQRAGSRYLCGYTEMETYPSRGPGDTEQSEAVLQLILLVELIQGESHSLLNRFVILRY